MATHSSTPAWRIPWTEELGGLLWRVHGVAKELDMTATKQQLQTNETLGELTSLVVLVTFQTLDGHLRPLVTSCTLQIIEHICHHRKFYIQYWHQWYGNELGVWMSVSQIKKEEEAEGRKPTGRAGASGGCVGNRSSLLLKCEVRRGKRQG